MPIMEIKILPLGTETPSVSEHIVNAVKELEQKGVKYELTSMGTIMEADTIEQLFDMAGQMHKAAFRNNVQRIVTFIEVDDRKDKNLTMHDKLESAKARLSK